MQQPTQIGGMRVQMLTRIFAICACFACFPNSRGIFPFFFHQEGVSKIPLPRPTCPPGTDLYSPSTTQDAIGRLLLRSAIYVYAH